MRGGRFVISDVTPDEEEHVYKGGGVEADSQWRRKGGSGEAGRPGVLLMKKRQVVLFVLAVEGRIQAIESREKERRWCSSC